MNAIRKRLGDAVALLLLAAVGIGVGAYIFSNQRLRFPFIQEKPFQLKAAFSTGQAVTPGQGQTVRVSGIRIGDISKVSLKDGQAVLTMDIEQKYKNYVRENATALLRPKTGLKDMFVELDPGTAPARLVKPGYMIPIKNTLPDVNPDEILSVLDNDTREYLKLLVNDLGRGLKGRAGDLQEVYRRFEPTHRDLARVNGAVAVREANLRRVIRSLNLINTELASKKRDLTQLVGSSSQVFRAFASEQANLSRTISGLPPALSQTRVTLDKVRTLADTLGPAAERLRPVARAIAPANAALIPLAREGTPLLAQSIRPFVREARPLVRQLRPGSVRLARSTPDLTKIGRQANIAFNTLAFNPGGAEGPGKRSRDEGFLYWGAWLGHIGVNLFSTADANGPYRPVAVAGSCRTFQTLITGNPIAEDLTNVTGLLTGPCKQAGSPVPPFIGDVLGKGKGATGIPRNVPLPPYTDKNGGFQGLAGGSPLPPAKSKR